MPRGVPNAKRDESALKFTSFHVPLAPNPKHVGSTYLKYDSSIIWNRNAARTGKRPTVDDMTTSEGRRGSKVLVIHPGSKWLRIGRASDVTPTSVPNVIARKHKPPVPPQIYVENITRPREDRRRGHPSVVPQPGDEYAVAIGSDDPFDAKVAAITVSLRDRMRFYKLRVTANAATIASNFNEQFKPETIPEVNDPYRVNWITTDDKDFLIGDEALRLSDPSSLGYVIRWPIYGRTFNDKGYPSHQLVLEDIETILRTTLKEKLGIDEHTYKEYSVVLVIPDFYDRNYVRDFVRMLLITMGFKQLCAQQESLAATYGAGISNACVVDMGACKTSIACVDDGLVIADSRMCLSMGGDDITEFLYVLLEKISFPYRDVNLARSYDWNVMEDLKARLCTLAEGDVALNLYDFVVRRPGHPTEKYGLRAYDEIILAPMCLFEPRVIEFDNKRTGGATSVDVTEEIVEQPSDYVTQAMMISTQHLLPTTTPNTIILQQQPPHQPPLELPQPPASGTQTPGNTESVNVNGSVQGTEQAATQSSSPADKEPEATTAAVEELSAGTAATSTPSETQENGTEAGTKPDDTQLENSTVDTSQFDAARQEQQASVPVTAEGTADAPISLVDIDMEDDSVSKPAETTSVIAGSFMPQLHLPPQPTQTYPGGFPIDVFFEASKLPLDVAIFNSARASGGDEKIRKYLQAVLVIGGTALTPGMAHALESRLQAIATPLVPNMEKVQIIPPPKDVDPRVLAWKGAAVLGKMEGVADLWITADEWDVMGMRGLKERCFYL
ncbi:actin-like ATPase domain-containing protein [Panus rudis PR-1116 ss-1]|nr:actin-like ATPase domain-containing protein [Panus rudis PR-1116 ss-1]